MGIKGTALIDGKRVEGEWIGFVNSAGELRNPIMYGQNFNIPTQYNTVNVQASETALLNSNALREAYPYFKDRWIELGNSDSLLSVAAEISELSHEKYANFTMEPFLGNIVTMYALTKDGKRVRVSDLGEGIQIYVSARLLYELLQPKVLLWDDFESHLIPGCSLGFLAGFTT